jgi:hypothetical protein
LELLLEVLGVGGLVLGDLDYETILVETETFDFLAEDLHDSGLGMQFVHVVGSEVEVGFEVAN